MENVPQVIGKNNISLFGEWCQFLINLGYTNYYKLLNAKDFGIPQNRERCFMVSILQSENKEFVFDFDSRYDKKLVLSDIMLQDRPNYLYGSTENFPHYLGEIESTIKPKVSGKHNELLLRSYINCATSQFESNSRIYYDNGICNTLTAKNSVDITFGQLIKVYICNTDDIVGLTSQEHFRLMGVKDEDYNKLSCSDRQKYKQAGNSIVVNVLMAIFENLFIKDCKTNKLF